jgi:23S rRNA pseudouridine1911/1915/1917 synthase
MMTLLDLLVLLHPESSKSTLRSWLEKGRVYVNGKVVKKGSQLIQKGAEVSLGRRSHFIDRGIEILYEDRDVIVVNKPEGLLSVETEFDRGDSVHSSLKRRYHTRRVYPVHRLDREASGVMVFTYTESAREGMKRQFFDHHIQRDYIAVAEGLIEPPSGTWNHYLKEGKDYIVRKTSEADSEGQHAISHYQVVAKSRAFTFLRVTLETGRKNQIRVHCQLAGHPIYGDKKYGARAPYAPRLCLHAEKLSFTHPETKEWLSFTSPIPEAFLRLFSRKYLLSL